MAASTFVTVWVRRLSFGLPETELHGAGTVLAHTDQLLAGQMPTYQTEKRYFHKDGHEVWIYLSTSRVRDAQSASARLIFQIQDITDRKRAEQQLLHDAFHNTLTGLPNRDLFIDRLKLTLARAKRLGAHQFAVLFLDLDRFKVINDPLGHMIGDQLLVGIARRLETCLRPGDTVARLGGDEFTILLEDVEWRKFFGGAGGSMRARSLGHIFNGVRGALLLSSILFASGSARQLAAQELRAATPEEAAREGAARETRETKEEGGGWGVSAYLGGASTRPTTLDISQPSLGTRLSFEGVRLAGRSFDPPLYYGLRGGYFFRRKPSVGVEAEFTHLKVFSDPAQRVAASGQLRGQPFGGEVALGSVVRQYSISHGANLLLFNLAGRHRAGRSPDAPAGRLILAARAGLGPTIPHTESNVEGQAQQQYELGRLSWQLAGGAEVKLWRGLYALGEYKFTRTRQRGRIFSGEARSLLRTHHGVFGLSYHFD